MAFWERRQARSKLFTMRMTERERVTLDVIARKRKRPAAQLIRWWMNEEVERLSLVADVERLCSRPAAAGGTSMQSPRAERIGAKSRKRGGSR
jgi:hypothetical protein